MNNKQFFVIIVLTGVLTYPLFFYAELLHYLCDDGPRRRGYNDFNSFVEAQKLNA